MRNNNLSILFLVNAYNSFQKDLIESIAPNCKQIYVFVRFRLGSNYLKYFSFLNLTHFEDSNLIKLENLPKNVQVFRVPVFFLPLTIIRKKIFNKFYKGILKIIKIENIKFDLIHSVFTEPSGKAALLLSEKYKKPFVHTLYENDNWLTEIIENKQFDFQEFENKAAFFTSNSYRSKFNFKIPNFTIIYNGYNSNLYYQKSKEETKEYLKLDKSKKYLINISTVDERKNHELLILAFCNLTLKYQNYNLLLIGDGPKMKYIKELINKLHLQDRITLVGYQPHSKLNDWINASEFFVLPSKAEGNPTVMFETLGTGTPFITTNVGGVSEIINEDCGKVIHDFEVNSMTDAIEKAINKKWDKNKIVEYSKQFEITVSAQKYTEIYEKVLNDCR